MSDMIPILICSVFSMVIGFVVGNWNRKDAMELQHELDSIAIEELKEALKDNKHDESGGD